MNKIFYRILTWLVLPLANVGLLFALYLSIKEPVDFENQRTFRQREAIQRLKDIRDLQKTFYSVYGRYAPTMDSLIWFYNEDMIEITRTIGSNDDSAAVAYTETVKKRIKSQMGKKIKNENDLIAELDRLYQAGDTRLVFQTRKRVPVKDELFKGRTNFVVDSLRYIPHSGGDTVIMRTTLSEGKNSLPLFEACMPIKSLLKGLDNQLRINLDAAQEDKGHYKGLKVGDADTQNGNAGNWEEEVL